MKRLSMTAFLVLAASLMGQPEARAPLDTVEDVLAGFLKANGGQENVDSVVSLRAQGKVSREGEEDLEIVVVRKTPNRKRVSVFLDGLTHHRGFDGETSWTMLERKDGQRQVTLMEGEAKARFEADRFHLDMLYYPSDSTLHHRLKGVEYVGRIPCYIVESSFDGIRRDSFLDSRTFRLVRAVEYLPGPDGAERVTTRDFSDYTRVHNLWMARTIEQHEEGVPTSTIHFDKVTVNEGIFDDVFEVPEVAD